MLLRLAGAGTEKNSWGESLSVASPWTCCFVLKKRKTKFAPAAGNLSEDTCTCFIDLFIYIVEQQYHHCMLKLNHVWFIAPVENVFCVGLVLEQLQVMFMTSALTSLQSFCFLLRSTWAKYGSLFSHFKMKILNLEILCVCRRRVVQYWGNIHVLCGEELLERFLRRDLQCLHLQSAGCVEQRWRWDGLMSCCYLSWCKVQVHLDLWPFFCIFFTSKVTLTVP